jgi:hypothetical protein
MEPGGRGMSRIALMVLGLVLMAGSARRGWAQPAPDPSPPAAKPAKLEHIQKAQAEGILGEAVLDAKGDKIGRIVDVLINAEGTPHAAVIEFAGFLGVGNRDIAVDWKALHFAVAKSRIVISLDLDAAKLKAMPAYKTDAKTVPVAAPAKPKEAAKPAPGQAGAPKAQPAGIARQGAASPAGAP